MSTEHKGRLELNEPFRARAPGVPPLKAEPEFHNQGSASSVIGDFNNTSMGTARDEGLRRLVESPARTSST